MTMITSVEIVQVLPAFENEQMVLGQAVVEINFQEQQNHFKGQVTLTNTDDGISFATSKDELCDLAIRKAKLMIAKSELPKPYVSAGAS